MNTNTKPQSAVLDLVIYAAYHFLFRCCFMVRNYQRKLGSHRYRANTRNFLALSEEYGIRYVTLYRKIKVTNSKKLGGQDVLKEEEEATLMRRIVVIGVGRLMQMT